MANINYATATGTLNAQSKGFTKAALSSTAERTANADALQDAIDFANANQLELYVPPGTYQIYGTPQIPHANFRLRGTLQSQIKQYKQDAEVLHLGPPIGTPDTTGFGICVDGLWLTYDGVAVAGGYALGGTALYYCNVRNIICGNPFAGGSSTDLVTRRGVWLDGTSGVIASFSNTFENIYIKNFTENGWHQFHADYAAATGNRLANVYISAGGAGDLRDITGTGNGIAFYCNALAQSSLDQVNVEWSTCAEAFHFEVCRCLDVKSINLEGITLKNAALNDACLVNMYQSQGTFHGVMAQNNTFSSANNVQNPSFFRLQNDSYVDLRALYTEENPKSGISNLALFRSNSLAPGNTGFYADESAVTFGPNHRIDRFSDFVYNAAAGHHFGVLGDFNNNMPLTGANANTTLYAYRTPGIVNVPATATRDYTLARQLSATDACRIPPGTRRTLINTGSGAGLIQPKNYNAANIGTTIALGAKRDFVFDGTDWIAA